jgi:hypothetical protein
MFFLKASRTELDDEERIDSCFLELREVKTERKPFLIAQPHGSLFSYSMFLFYLL